MRLILFWCCALLLTGCFSRTSADAVTATPSAEPVNMFGTATPSDTQGTPAEAPPVPPTATPAPLPTPPPAAEPIRLWVSPNVPMELLAALNPLVGSGRLVWADEPNSQVRLVPLPSGVTSPLTARWLYVPVVPFGTVADNIALSEIERYWRGDVAALAGLTPDGQPPALVTTAPIFFWLTTVLGSPAPNVVVDIQLQANVAQAMWARRAAWGLVPFGELDPTLKALTLDGLNIFDRAMPVEQWRLVETFGLVGDPVLVNEAAAAVNAAGLWPSVNRDLSRMTILIMTGVTALTRATAYRMEVGGITLPVRDIAPFLADGDLIHTSNEVAFAKDCPYPNPNSTSLIFCAREQYFDLLRAMRLNLVELTGNHVNDWGTAALNYTLDLYEANGIQHFGGGRNTEDARKAVIVEHNGNKIAFLGCNPVGPPGAWADEERPGAATCDDLFLGQEIPRLRSVADVVVMTIQFHELYRYSVPAEQQAFFQKYAQVGAQIVIGSQAHQPQAFAFAHGAFIHYGLGNLFFDQMASLATRQLFANKLIIYQGRHLSTMLFTGLIEDYSRPRPMTPQERAAFLQTIFTASGW